MPESIKKGITDFSFTQNRELSWLRFNERVLEEAQDETVPIIERFKFVSIFTSNLDEFFMVRVGSLFDLAQITPDEKDNKTGDTPTQQLKKIFDRVPYLVEKRDKTYAKICSVLEECGIYDINENDLTDNEEKIIETYFENIIYPVLSPQIIDPRHPFPHLKNKQLYIASIIRDKKNKPSLGIIPVPESLPPFITLSERPFKFIRTENIILNRCEKIFDIYNVTDSAVVSITRNADISFDEEKFDDAEEDYLKIMSHLLKKRGRLAPVRLEIHGEKESHSELSKIFTDRLSIEKNQIFFTKSPINMKYVFNLEKKLPDMFSNELRYIPYSPRFPENLDPHKSITEQIKERDRLLFYPFDQMEPFLKLLKESANDPKVVSIKITIYRLASVSKIAHELCNAAENGKDVTVLVELRARFDEANNIAWAERLEQSGCRVIYGIDNFKCHSKICLITRHENNSIQYITQIGTGNYNEKTALMYTDLSFITADEKIGHDATVFFQNMLLANINGNYESLLVAPVSLKPNLMNLIDEEIKKGAKGRIIIKANSLTERDIIDKFYEASCAGVKINLILRGICCLRPGIEGKTENITVTSIVGRYLEHSRIYCFGTGENTKIFISSADLMTRNITRRVEIACPIYDNALKSCILKILQILLKDNVKARVLLSDGTYIKKEIKDGDKIIDSQKYFQEHSLHPGIEFKPVAKNHVSKEESTGFINKIFKLFKN